MDQQHTENSKRIAKNTFVLYLRTIVMMLISLYTSRIVLELLGVDNYGILNVVGGVVGMFSIISGSLASSISRYLTFEIGTRNKERLKKVFSTSINIQCFIGLVILLIGETAGIWFLNTKLNIPDGRMIAAHWVLQCSLLSFVVGLISVPYNACIIAHERMNVFAYMTILDVVLKLLFVYLLFISPFDKLISYTVMMLVVSIIMRIIYGIYCARHFEECHYEKVFDKPLLKEMTSFAWWGFFGNTAWIFNTQGVNILINMFFGVAFNAARGVAGQIEGAVMQFIGNFTTALNPQITKSYAEGDKDYLFSLICRGTKYTFYLTLLFMIPVCFEANTLLSIWLIDVPPYSALFLRLSVLCTIATQYGGTAYTAIMATGKLKTYQITVTLIGCLVFPFTWLTYKLGMPVESVYYVFFPIYLILVYVRLIFLKRMMNFPISMFVRNTIYPSLLVLCLSIILPLLVVNYMTPSFLRLICTTAISIISLCFTIWGLGMNLGERKMMLGVIRRRLNKIGFLCTKS